MKTFNQFVTEVYSDDEAAKVAPGMDPAKRKAALERSRLRNAKNQSSTTPGKALPGGSNALVKTGKVTPTTPKKTTMSKREDDKREVGVRTDMPKVQTPQGDYKNKPKEKKSLGDYLSSANKAGKGLYRKYKSTRRAFRNVFNKPGSTNALGDGDAQTGKSTSIDRG